MTILATSCRSETEAASAVTGVGVASAAGSESGNSLCGPENSPINKFEGGLVPRQFAKLLGGSLRQQVPSMWAAHLGRSSILRWRKRASAEVSHELDSYGAGFLRRRGCLFCC
jgi:hypothetical protein